MLCDCLKTKILTVIKNIRHFYSNTPEMSFCFTQKHSLSIQATENHALEVKLKTLRRKGGRQLKLFCEKKAPGRILYTVEKKPTHSLKSRPTLLQSPLRNGRRGALKLEVRQR